MTAETTSEQFIFDCITPAQGSACGTCHCVSLLQLSGLESTCDHGKRAVEMGESFAAMEVLCGPNDAPRSMCRWATELIWPHEYSEQS